MKKSIALIYGGNSEEAGISVQSGKNVAANICREEYEVYELLLKGVHWRVLNPSGGMVEEGVAERGLENPGEVGVEVDKTDFSFVWEGRKVKFDMAFIMIHGNIVSVGCFAMTNSRIEEIYTLVDEAFKAGAAYVPVQVYPFRMTDERMQKEAGNKHINFWQHLLPGWQYTETNKAPYPDKDNE